MGRPSKALDTSRSSMIFFPRRLEAAAICTASSVSGASWFSRASYRWIRSLDLVVRALQPRMIHSRSTRRMDWRLRSLASAISARCSRSSRYLE